MVYYENITMTMYMLLLLNCILGLGTNDIHIVVHQRERYILCFFLLYLSVLLDIQILNSVSGGKVYMDDSCAGSFIVCL